MTGIEKALTLYEGSPTKMAAAIPQFSRQNIEHWVRIGYVPAAKALDVAAATGVAVEDLCPNANWQAIRAAA